MPLSVPSPPAPRYSGPLPVLTAGEASLVLPFLRDRPELAAIVQRLEAAAGAHPVWKKPHP